MTDEQIEHQIKIIKEVSKELLKDKEAAIKFLKDAGISMGLEKSPKTIAVIKKLGYGY